MGYAYFDTDIVDYGERWNVEFAKQLEDMGVSRIVLPPPSFAPDDLRRAFGELSESFVVRVG